MLAASAALAGAAMSRSLFAATTAPATTSNTMLEKPIPSTSEKIPVIGMGTWQTFDIGDAETERAPLRDVLNAFYALGGRVIDSSPMYGRSEDVVGDLSSELDLLGKLFVATKVWTTGKDKGIAQMKESMQKLRVGKIDLMQVHNLVDVETHLDTLAGWKKDGKIRYLGVTHYTASAHDAVARVVEMHPLDVLQINYSVGERDAENRLLPLAKDKGVAVIANRPLGGGNLLRDRAGKPVPDFAKNIACTSWAQLLLKFVVSHDAITCAIPATSKVAHLRDNMQAGTGPMPDAKQRELIAKAFA